MTTITIKKKIYHIYSVFFVYISFLLSSYFEYVSESFLLWQAAYVVFFLITVLFFYKKVILDKYFSLIIAYMLTYQIFTSFFGDSLTYDTLRFLQFLLTIYFAFFSFSLADIEYFYLKKIVRIYQILTVLIIAVAVYQFFMRPLNMNFTLSDHQRYREVGAFYSSTSFFYEPRGLAQFLCVALFLGLFTNIFSKSKMMLALITIGIILSFSLGGMVVLCVIYLLYFVNMLNSFRLKWNRLLIIFPLLAVILTLFINSIAFDNFKKRIDFMFDNFSSLDIGYILNEGYKINHINYYNENHKDLEKVFSIKGGSETVSTVVEASYLWYILRTNFVFGRSPSIKERHVTLNFIVDLISRLGIFGLLIIALNYVSKFKYLPYKKSTFFFIIIYSGIDGASAKPQVWFLLSMIPIAFNYLYYEKSDT